jgi:hypothetical protein
MLSTPPLSTFGAALLIKIVFFVFASECLLIVEELLQLRCREKLNFSGLQARLQAY